MRVLDHIWMVESVGIAVAGLLMTASPASAIVGGKPAAAGEFPFMLSVQRNGKHSCGAVLLTPRTAVTTAHCVDGASPSSLKVRSGSLQTSSGGSLTAVIKVIVHPSWNSRNTDNDIALLHLGSSVSDATAVQLPAQGEDPSGGTVIQIAGWGTTGNGAPLAKDLLKANESVVDRAKCRQTYGSNDITDAMFCTDNKGSQGWCQGDEGGPIIDGKTLVGLPSRIGGTGCAQAANPEVNTRVGLFVGWIKQNEL